MLCILGGKQKSKMADEFVKTFPELNSYSSVAKKNKNELRKICEILELPSQKLGKNALINIVCNSLKFQQVAQSLMLETPTRIRCLQVVMWRYQHA